MGGGIGWLSTLRRCEDIWVVCRRSKGMWWVGSSSRGMGLCSRWMGVCLEKWIGVDESVAYDCVKDDGEVWQGDMCDSAKGC